MARKKTVSDVITIYDVAREADVSLATVSRVMNKSAHVKPEKEARVLEAIKVLNYKPNMIARGLASKKSTTIGLLIIDTERLSNLSVVSGVIDVANMSEYNYGIKLNSYQGDNANIQASWDEMLSKQVDGILFMCDVVTPEIEEMIAKTQTEVVLLNTYAKSKAIANVSLDYNKLFKDILANSTVVDGSDYVYVTRQQAYGAGGDFLADLFVSTAKQNNKIIDNKQIINLDGGYESAYNFFINYLKSNQNKYIISESDSFAAACINAASDLNIKIPEDIQIFSLMTTKLTDVLRPKVSGVNYPYYKVGAVAMRLLTKYMKGEEVISNKYVVDYTIDWRDTTKK